MNRPLNELSEAELLRKLDELRPGAASAQFGFQVWDPTEWQAVYEELRRRGYEVTRSGELAKIVDPREKAVFDALADWDWDFRTAEGIARETRIDLDQVQSILNTHLGKLVRESAVPDRLGRRLYALGTRPLTSEEQWALSRAFISKST
jgi:hypothetical protein